MRHRLVLRISTLLVAALLLLAGMFAVRKASTPARGASLTSGALSSDAAAPSGDAATRAALDATHAALIEPESANATDLDGAFAFDRNCASCHVVGDLARGLRAASDPARHVLRTLEFLEDHWTDGDAQARAILRHILGD